MNQSQKLSSELSSKTSRISKAVCDKFVILVLLTLVLMFDTVCRQPNSDLLESATIHERSIAQ